MILAFSLGGGGAHHDLVYFKHGLSEGASGLRKHWASGRCPRSPQLPRTSGPSSCSTAALSVRPLQASVPLLVSAGARREVPLSHSLPHPQEGDFSMWRGNFLSL